MWFGDTAAYHSGRCHGDIQRATRHARAHYSTACWVILFAFQQQAINQRTAKGLPTYSKKTTCTAQLRQTCFRHNNIASLFHCTIHSQNMYCNSRKVYKNTVRPTKHAVLSLFKLLSIQYARHKQYCRHHESFACISEANIICLVVHCITIVYCSTARTFYTRLQ